MHSRLQCKNRYPIYDQNGGKIAKIDTQCMTKTAEKPYPLAPHIPIEPILGRTPPGPQYHWRNLVLRTYFCQSLGPSLYRGFYVRASPAAKIQTFLLRRIFAFTNIYLFLWRDRFHFWTKAEAYICFWRKPWRINLKVYFYKLRRRRVDILSTQPVTCSYQEKKHGLPRALNI